MMGVPDIQVVGGALEAAGEVDTRAAALNLGLDASYEEWLRVGEELTARHSSAAWEAADWLAYGGARWAGERLEEAADRLGISPEKISNYIVVSDTYTTFDRRKSLTFSHHLEAARLPAAARGHVLDAAETGGWTVLRTRQAVREQVMAERRRCAARKPPDPDAADRMRERVKAERRFAAGAAKRLGRLATQATRSDVIGGLHGNAQRGLARDLRRAFGTASEMLRTQHADVAVEIVRLEAAPGADDPDPTECAVAALVNEIDPILRAAGARIAQASQDAAGTPAADRRALAVRLEAAIAAGMAAVQTALDDAVQPALARLADET